MVKLDETVAGKIKSKLGETEGQKIVDRLVAANTADEVEQIAEEFESVAGILRPIVIVWRA